MSVTRLWLALLSGAVFAVSVSAADAAVGELVDHSHLRVCADPANLPFSNEKGEGFENKIADLLAAKLNVPVLYTFFPQGPGFIKSTLALGKCDLVMAAGTGGGLAQITSPYYESGYVMAYRPDHSFAGLSLNDEAFKTAKIGAVVKTPPIDLLSRHQLLAQLQPYMLAVDTRLTSPAADMVRDVVAGKLDVALVWGPIAGYLIKQEHLPLQLTPLADEAGSPHMDYKISMAVRPGEDDWKHTIDDLLVQNKDAITQILVSYGVPLINSGQEAAAQAKAPADRP